MGTSAAVNPTSGALVTAATVLEDIHAVAPEVEMFLPLIPGVGAQALLIAKLADGLDVLVANALATIASNSGVSPLEAVSEFVNHITPGAPNSPALSSPAAPPVVDAVQS